MLPRTSMAFSLLPDDPVGRREAEGYLHGLTKLMILGGFLSALMLWLLYSVAPLLGKKEALLVLGIIVINQTVFAVCYLNGRRRYRYFSSSVQAVVMLITVNFAITANLNFFGSTSLSLASIYVLSVVAGTLYLRPRAGVVALVFALFFYGGLLLGEGLQWIPYAPHSVEAYDFANFSTHATRCFGEVFFGSVIAFALSYYIARELKNRRMEAVRDKEAIEEAHAKLQELDEAKSRFLSVVSHDLRTPITSIKAFGEIVEEDVEGESKKFAHTIVTEADRLNRLVTDLLDLDKIQAGKMEWDLTPIDIRPVLLSVAEVFRAAAGDKNITLAEEIADELPQINADGDRVSQLVANLLSNAIKFTPEGGTVTLAATANGDGSSLDVRITDTGPGIAREDIEHIFDRFSQTATGRKTKGGTGLGLAIAKEIAAGHGGTLTAASTLGEGATFIVMLPV